MTPAAPTARHGAVQLARLPLRRCGLTRWAKAREASAPYHRPQRATLPTLRGRESFASLTVGL